MQKVTAAVGRTAARPLPARRWQLFNKFKQLKVFPKVAQTEEEKATVPPARRRH